MNPSHSHRPSLLSAELRRGWGKALGMLLLLFTFAVSSTAIGQINDEDSLYSDELEPLGDTTAQDSQKVKKVKEKTDWLDPVSLMNGYNLRTDAAFKLEQVMYPDFVDRVGGFTSSLGQWGKPYMRYIHGAEASNYDLGVAINPVTGAENGYFLDAQHGMRYYDTRTPYVNAYYAQGKGDAAQLRVDVAQNVHPLVNASLLYYRRQSNGVYSNFVTDHNTLGATSNFHTLNERYQVYAHFLVQKHDDNLNGGVLLTLPDSGQFGKGTQPVVLENANLRRFSRAAAMRQFYRITKDTAQAKHQLLLYNGWVAEYFLNQYIDHDVSPDLNSGLYTVYPTVGLDSNYFYEKLEYRYQKVDVGISYRLNTPNWKAKQRLEVAQEFGTFRKNLVDRDIRKFTVLWKGQLRNDPNPRDLEANWTYRQTFTNVFNPETYAELNLAYRFPKWRLDYSHRVPGPPLKPQDSTTVTKTHRPLALNLHVLSYGRNPTLQQAFGVPWPGNSMQVLDNLSNRRLRHLSLGMEWRGKSTWTSTGELPGNHLIANAFLNRQSGMIYFTPTGWEHASLKSSVVYAGLEVKLRAHLRRFYLESETVWQGFSSASSTLTDLQSFSQPKFYTKTSLFYENKDLKFTSVFRLGLDLWYFSSFSAPYFDPASQAFYSQNDYVQYAYPRVDGFLATQVKRAFIYVKMINLFEGLPQPGYFTTTAYPMPVRQLMLGLNWTFFD